MRRAPIILASLALVVASGAALLAVVLFSRVGETQHEGRTQFCELFQRSHLQAVRQRDDTVKFLKRPPPGLDSPAFVKVVRANLPHLRAEVHATKVPAVCGPLLKP